VSIDCHPNSASSSTMFQQDTVTVRIFFITRPDEAVIKKSSKGLPLFAFLFPFLALKNQPVL